MKKITVKNPFCIKLEIAKSGRNLKEFAYDVEVSASYLSQILNGKRTPSILMAEKISKELEKEVGELFFIKGLINRSE